MKRPSIQRLTFVAAALLVAAITETAFCEDKPAATGTKREESRRFVATKDGMKEVVITPEQSAKQKARRARRKAAREQKKAREAAEKRVDAAKAGAASEAAKNAIEGSIDATKDAADAAKKVDPPK